MGTSRKKREEKANRAAEYAKKMRREEFERDHLPYIRRHFLPFDMEVEYSQCGPGDMISMVTPNGGDYGQGLRVDVSFDAHFQGQARTFHRRISKAKMAWIRRGCVTVYLILWLAALYLLPGPLERWRAGLESETTINVLATVGALIWSAIPWRRIDDFGWKAGKNLAFPSGREERPQPEAQAAPVSTAVAPAFAPQPQPMQPPSSEPVE